MIEIMSLFLYQGRPGATGVQGIPGPKGEKGDSVNYGGVSKFCNAVMFRCNLDNL